MREPIEAATSPFSRLHLRDALLLLLTFAQREFHYEGAEAEVLRASIRRFLERVLRAHDEFLAAPLATTTEKVSKRSGRRLGSYSVSRNTSSGVQLAESLKPVFKELAMSARSKANRSATVARLQEDALRLCAEHGITVNDEARSRLSPESINEHGGASRALPKFLGSVGPFADSKSTLYAQAQFSPATIALAAHDIRFRTTQEALEYVLQTIGYEDLQAAWIAEQLLRGKRRLVTPARVREAVEQLPKATRRGVPTAESVDSQVGRERTPRVVRVEAMPRPHSGLVLAVGPTALATCTAPCVVGVCGPPSAGVTGALTELRALSKGRSTFVDPRNEPMERLQGRVAAAFARGAEVVFLDGWPRSANDVNRLIELGLPPVGGLMGFARFDAPTEILLKRATASGRQLDRRVVGRCRRALAEAEARILELELPYSVIPALRASTAIEWLAQFSGAVID